MADEAASPGYENSLHCFSPVWRIFVRAAGVLPGRISQARRLIRLASRSLPLR
jgi:hypothetical protein